MKKAVYNILPRTEEILKTMGEQIKLARLRRDLPATLVAERAGISRATLWKMDKDMLLIAKDDEMGRRMQDLNLITRKRATRRSKT